MRPGLFTLSWSLSLLVLVAICSMWARSYWVGDAMEWRRVTRDEREIYSWYLLLGSGRGGVGLSRDAEDYDAASATLRDIGSRWSFVEWRRGRPNYPQAVFHAGAGMPVPAFALRWRGPLRRELIVPYWVIALIFALAPAFQLRRVLRERSRRHRQAAGRCTACGYDLRATPERCPECGAAAPQHL